MMTLIVAAALAAQPPVAPASQSKMQMGEASKHSPMKHMDCCECCKEMMAKMHEGHRAMHSEHKHQ